MKAVAFDFSKRVVLHKEEKDSYRVWDKPRSPCIHSLFDDHTQNAICLHSLTSMEYEKNRAHIRNKAKQFVKTLWTLVHCTYSLLFHSYSKKSTKNISIEDNARRSVFATQITLCCRRMQTPTISIVDCWKFICKVNWIGKICGVSDTGWIWW